MLYLTLSLTLKSCTHSRCITDPHCAWLPGQDTSLCMPPWWTPTRIPHCACLPSGLWPWYLTVHAPLVDPDQDTSLCMPPWWTPTRIPHCACPPGGHWQGYLTVHAPLVDPGQDTSLCMPPWWTPARIPHCACPPGGPRPGYLTVHAPLVDPGQDTSLCMPPWWTRARIPHCACPPGGQDNSLSMNLWEPGDSCTVRYPGTGCINPTVVWSVSEVSFHLVWQFSWYYRLFVLTVISAFSINSDWCR